MEVAEKNKLKVPKLRFPGFEGAWEEKRLGEVYKYFTTNSYSRDCLNYDSGEVWNIHYGDIHTKFKSHFEIENELVPRINSEIDLSKIKDECYAQEGDLVIADASEDYADIGKTIELKDLNGRKVLAGLHTYLARPKNGSIAKGFGAFMFQSWNMRYNIMRLSQGSKVLSISRTNLDLIKIELPSKEEQKKIADFLSAVDARIGHLNRKKELLEKYKKGVMQKLFSQELRFKRPDGTDYPDWEEKRLGALTFKVGKKNKANIQYPIYSINNQEGFRPQSEQFDGLDSNDRGYDISMYKIVYSQTFAYNPARINVGSIGYSYDLNEVIISSLYVCFKTKDALNDLYLLAYLDSYSFNKDILRYE